MMSHVTHLVTDVSFTVLDKEGSVESRHPTMSTDVLRLAEKKDGLQVAM